MLWPYGLKALAWKSNKLKVDDYGITPMENFASTTTYITIKNHHTWGYLVYVLGAILQGNISGIPKREPHSRAGIYLGHSPFHAGSVALVLNLETRHVSPQFHVVIDDEFSPVIFMREGTMPPNWTYIVQRRSQSGALDNIDLGNTWFTPDIEEDPIETPIHEPSVAL